MDLNRAFTRSEHIHRASSKLMGSPVQVSYDQRLSAVLMSTKAGPLTLPTFNSNPAALTFPSLLLSKALKR